MEKREIYNPLIDHQFYAFIYNWKVGLVFKEKSFWKTYGGLLDSLGDLLSLGLLGQFERSSNDLELTLGDSTLQRATEVRLDLK